MAYSGTLLDSCVGSRHTRTDHSTHSQFIQKNPTPNPIDGCLNRRHRLLADRTQVTVEQRFRKTVGGVVTSCELARELAVCEPVTDDREGDS